MVSIGAGAGIGTEFAAASQPAWWIVVGCGAAVFLLALVTTGQWARRSTGTVVALLDVDAPRAPVMSVER